MISVSGLSKRFGGQVLFDDVSLQFGGGHRYGVVGANGSGKSTLLRILTGEEEPSAGTVNRPNKLRVGFLRQDHYRYEQSPILDTVLMGRERLWHALESKHVLLEKSGEFTEEDGYKLSELEEVILAEDGYAAEAEGTRILEGLGIPESKQRDLMSTLSGGYKLRVLLAQLLFSEPEMMLLDEPTNHLDLFSIRWLERYLQGVDATVMVVSHDQRFINRISTHIVDVDYETVKIYTGNYDQFVVKKALDREQKEKAISKQERRKDELEKFVTRFKAKASKARQAQSKAKQIERMEDDVIELARSSRCYPRFRFEAVRHSGIKPLEVVGVSKAFGDNQVLSEVSFEIKRGERVAVIGPNGIGKSTLLRILTGELAADAGEFEWGYETHVGYFPQDHAEEVHGDMTVTDWLWQYEASATIGKIRGLLGRALFTGDDGDKKVTTLSGGESGRLILSRLMLMPHNMLLLDEPTNHLDLEAIDQLADALAEYDGTLLFVSHNRHFVSKIANRVLAITQEGIRDYLGTYAEFIERWGEDYLDQDVGLKRTSSPPAESKPGPEPERPPKSQKARRELKKRVARLEEEVGRLEAAKEEAEQVFLDWESFNALPPEEQKAAKRRQQQLERQLAETMEAWEAALQELEC